MWTLVRHALLSLSVLVAPSGCALDYQSFDVQAGGAGPGGGAGNDTGSGAAGATGGGGAGNGAGGAGASGFGGDGASASGGAGGAAGGAGGSGNAGGSGPSEVTFGASVADCTSTVNLSPDDCEAQAGTGHMVIDTLLGSFDSTPYHVFLRFDFDASLQGKTVSQAVLRLTVSNHNFAPGPSGELWQVTQFARSDLFSSLPTNVGGSAIGADIGSLDVGEIVEWSIPTNLITANGTLTLAVRPTSGDALTYWNNNGSVPPTLTVALD